MYFIQAYECLIIGRVSDNQELKPTPDQARFRPGRSTCQRLLNLTQNIEYSFENKEIIGSVFVDLKAAYDTVNHRLLLLKFAKFTQNSKIVRIIQSLITIRHFFVEMDGRKEGVTHRRADCPKALYMLQSCLTYAQMTSQSLKIYLDSYILMIWRETHAMTKKYKQEQDARHPIFEYTKIRERLKSSKSFATFNSLNQEISTVYRLGK